MAKGRASFTIVWMLVLSTESLREQERHPDLPTLPLAEPYESGAPHLAWPMSWRSICKATLREDYNK